MTTPEPAAFQLCAPLGELVPVGAALELLELERTVASDVAELVVPLGAVAVAPDDVPEDVALVSDVDEAVPEDVVDLDAVDAPLVIVTDVDEDVDVLCAEDVLSELVVDAPPEDTGVTTIDLGGVPDGSAGFLMVNCWLQLPVSPSTGR